MHNIVALVLAGGEGKRFWPLSVDKNLFPFFGKPLIDFSVREIIPDEVSKVVIVTNEKNDQAIKHISFKQPSTTIIQSKPLGFADAILTAKDLIKGSSLLVIIADHLVDKSLLDAVLAKAKNNPSVFGVLPGWHVKSYFPGGYLVLDGERIKNVFEKPGSGKEPSEYVYISGSYIADSDILIDVLEKTQSQRDDVYEKALDSLMVDHEFIMSKYEGLAPTLKYPWHVLEVMDYLLTNRLKAKRGNNVQIKQNVVIEGPVYIEDNVRIFENTKIVGPCYIGRDTIIGNNNIIRHSHIGAGCVTGFNTDVTRSYVGDNCWFHSNYIGDSVLEGNISLGSGAVLANLRLDEGEISSDLPAQIFEKQKFERVKGEKIKTGRNKLGAIIGNNVRIGVNASIMPGVKIGSGSFVGAGVILSQDLQDASFCLAKCECVITQNNQSIFGKSRTEFKNNL